MLLQSLVIDPVVSCDHVTFLDYGAAHLLDQTLGDALHRVPSILFGCSTHLVAPLSRLVVVVGAG